MATIKCYSFLIKVQFFSGTYFISDALCYGHLNTIGDRLTELHYIANMCTFVLKVPRCQWLLCENTL